MQVGALLVLAARLVGVALRARLHEQLLSLLGVTHLHSVRVYKFTLRSRRFRQNGMEGGKLGLQQHPPLLATCQGWGPLTR